MISRHRQRHGFIGGATPPRIQRCIDKREPEARRGFSKRHAPRQRIFHLIAAFISKIECAVLRNVLAQPVAQLIKRENLRGFHRFNANHVPAKGALHRISGALRQGREGGISQGRDGQAGLVTHGQSHGLAAGSGCRGFHRFPISTRLPKLRHFPRAGFISHYHLADLATLGRVILAVAGFESLFDIVFRYRNFSRQRFSRQHGDADLPIFWRGETLRVVFQIALQLRFSGCFRFRRGREWQQHHIRHAPFRLPHQQRRGLCIGRSSARAHSAQQLLAQ